MEQAEGERDEPRIARRDAFVTLPGARELDGDEDDAERDKRLDHRRAHVDITESGSRQRYAVREREGRDGLDESQTATHQQQQPEHEAQVVETGEDVFDPESQIRRHWHLAGAGEGNPERRRAGPEHRLYLLPTRETDGHQNVGDRVLESLDTQSRAVEGAVGEVASLPATNDEAVGGVFLIWRRVEQPVGQLGIEAQHEGAQARLLPQNVEPVRRALI